MWPSVSVVLGFALVIMGSHLLVDGASSLSKKLKVSDLVIGLTVVAFGTSLPELFVNITASIKGNTDIALGNILGSNISNIFLILGVCAIIFPLAVSKGTTWKEIPLSLLAAILVGVLANDTLIDNSGCSTLGQIDGLVLLSFFLIFIYYSIGIARPIEGLDRKMPSEKGGMTKVLTLIIVGLSLLILGSDWLVDGAVSLAVALGASQWLIGLTIVAVGTSLPELATSATAAYKRNPEIAVGNVVGSNIFNIFFILGISSTIRPIPFDGRNNVDILVVVAGSLALFFSMFTGKRRMLDRWEGLVLLVLYVGYIYYIVSRG
jgi:cation:H+ antiporter